MEQKPLYADAGKLWSIFRKMHNANLARNNVVEQQDGSLQLEVRLGIRQFAFADRRNERLAQKMVVATYRIHSESDHVNIVLTETEGTVRSELKVETPIRNGLHGKH